MPVLVRLVAWVVAVFVVLGLAAFSGVRWLNEQVSPSVKPGKAVSFVVKKGESTQAITDALGKLGVVPHPLVFRLYLKLHGSHAFDPGIYQVYQNESFPKIIDALSVGPTEYRLTIPEGYTIAQIANKVGAIPGHSSAGFVQALESGQVTSPYLPPGSSTFEGLLFPDTYFVTSIESDAQIAQMMVDRFNEIAKSTGLDQAQSQVGMSPYQVLTVASMVEREASHPQDRGKVAQVIYNRLAKGMKLQFDSTVEYALGNQVSVLTDSDLQTNSPYNTYLHYGLPPSPISNPGVAAIQAALHPTPGPWLYFAVVDAQGTETFETTLAQQHQDCSGAAAVYCAG